MSPLAARVARELTVPKKQRTFNDTADVLSLFDQEMHCFEVSALSASVNKAMDLDNLWPDIESMLPGLFLPSPVTWLEMMFRGARLACVIRQEGRFFSLSTVHESARGPFSLPMCKFRARGVLEIGERIEVDAAPLPFKDVKDPISIDAAAIMSGSGSLQERVRSARAAQQFLAGRADTLDRELSMMQTGLDVVGMANRFIGMTVLIIDLLNTPGLIGIRQRDPNRALARALRRIGVGRYPLQAWSEVVLKHETKIAGDVECASGSTYHKCLHFVRSHRRHYRSGYVTVIPAHWRGDPALGIKRTRYRAAA